MEKSPRKQSAILLVVSMIALTTFSRTAGAEAVRWVQILLLFVAGMCAGLALAGFLRRGQNP